MKFVRTFFAWIKKHKIISLIVLAVILIAAFLLRPKPAVLPETQAVKIGNLVQSISVSGSTASKKQANLSFIASGKLTYLGASLGDNVKAGQTVAAVDQRTLQNNIDNAVKAYENEKINYDVTNDFNGDRALSDTGLSIAARRQLETAVNTLDQSQIALEIQKIAKEQSFLVSPIDGILTRQDANTIGQNITTTTTFTVTDPSSIVFSMDVDEADIAKVATGEAVKISLDAFPDETLSYPVDRIDFVSHTTTNGGNAFTVEVKLPDDGKHLFRVGMNGNAEIITAEKDNVITVPITSIVDNKYVYIKTTKGYEKRSVSLGLQSDTDTEVKSGLTEGDIVVLQPEKIPQGMIK